jgi:hypothetical protein
MNAETPAERLARFRPTHRLVLTYPNGKIDEQEVMLVGRKLYRIDEWLWDLGTVVWTYDGDAVYFLNRPVQQSRVALVPLPGSAGPSEGGVS